MATLCSILRLTRVPLANPTCVTSLCGYLQRYVSVSAPLKASSQLYFIGPNVAHWILAWLLCFTEYFSKDHEWVTIDSGIGTVGITTYAREKIGDIVFVQLPDMDAEVKQNGEIFKFHWLIADLSLNSIYSKHSLISFFPIIFYNTYILYLYLYTVF